jgi:prepilin-type N-terminal cleavage/methylation domain-containing protein
MKNTKAFTLIEILIAVLIIAILAAIALPKYKLAVDKTRLMSLAQATFALRNAQENYYLANGTYAVSFAELDVDFSKLCPVTLDPSYLLCKGGTLDNLAGTIPDTYGNYAAIEFCPAHYTSRTECMNNMVLHLKVYFKNSPQPNKVVCTEKNAYGLKVCSSLGF